MADVEQRSRIAGNGRAARRLVAGSVLALAAIGCGPGRGTVRAVLEPFMEAAQSEDADALYCLCAGATEAEELGLSDQERRANFRSWLDSQYAYYLDARDAGLVELQGYGVVEVKLFALGRGTYYEYGPITPIDRNALTVRTLLRFGYSQLDLSGLPPGTTLYLNAAPPGQVHPVQIPFFSKEIELEVLQSLTLEWTLARGRPSDECGERWTVVSVSPVPGSATTTDLVWKF